ncbi:MAG: hypothetical protein IPK50_19565 [Fibrobacterota bacterium]|nr:MAG: hypothetical protein IPK50_19565 [Fibrobacterota bacterium]
MSTESENLKQYFEKSEKIEEYRKRLKLANQRQLSEIDDLVRITNAILAKNGILDAIDGSQIKFNANYIGNITQVSDKRLSDLIFEKIYPAPTRKIFSHYTKFDKGVSIIENSEFWLFNLLQNFSADEFVLFYREHGIDGYEQDTEVFGTTIGYRALMSEIFALCLTTEENSSPTLWEYFGNNGTGLKLTFEVESKIPDFREVYYSNITKPEPIKILKDLFGEIQSEFNLPLRFSYISKIGAFYIKGNFANEQEFRFLIKYSADNYNARKLKPTLLGNDISYITLPFESEYAKFKLIKVEKGSNCDLSAFNKIIPMIQSKHKDAQII